MPKPLQRDADEQLLPYLSIQTFATVQILSCHLSTLVHDCGQGTSTSVSLSNRK